VNPLRWVAMKLRRQDQDEPEPMRQANRLSETAKVLSAAQDKTLEAIDQLLSEDHPGPTGNFIEDMARGYYRVRETANHEPR
jgi:hypothetical protein